MGIANIYFNKRAGGTEGVYFFRFKGLLLARHMHSRVSAEQGDTGPGEDCLPRVTSPGWKRSAIWGGGASEIGVGGEMLAWRWSAPSA